MRARVVRRAAPVGLAWLLAITVPALSQEGGDPTPVPGPSGSVSPSPIPSPSPDLAPDSGDELNAQAACISRSYVDEPIRKGWDIKRVRTHTDDRCLAFTVVMRRKWGIRGRWDNSYLLLLLDTKGGPAPNLFIVVRSTGRGLRGDLWRVGGGGDSRLRRISAEKKGGRQILFRMPPAILREYTNGSSFRWSIDTLHLPGCGKVCIDRVPGGTGMITEPVP